MLHGVHALNSPARRVGLLDIAPAHFSLGSVLLLSLTRNPAGRAGLCPPNLASAITDLPLRTRTFPERIPSSFAVPVFSDFHVDVRTLAQKR